MNLFLRVVRDSLLLSRLGVNATENSDEASVWSVRRGPDRECLSAVQMCMAETLGDRILLLFMMAAVQ